jgi:polysaccharide export outer membrane protein
MKLIGNLLLFVLLVNVSACVSTRPIQYVEGQFDTARLSSYVVKDPRIQKGDLLSITVYSDNPQATTLFNSPNVAGGNISGGAGTSGYLVDESGNIQFQQIGNLKVEGLTKRELTTLLDAKLAEYLKNPYYNIRFLNYKITMIGEVSHEGVFTIPNERLNIFEAIGLAGGLTIYAKRQNVMVIREANGRREFARLDLTSPQIMQSPYYFLQQNDMVLVEQTRNKLVNNDQTVFRNISLATSVISTLGFIYTLIRQF